MTPHFDTNYSDVPDEIPQIPVGLATLRIDLPPEVKETREAKKTMLALVFRSTDPDLADCDPVFDNIVEPQTSARGKVRFKRLCLACGLTQADLSDGVNTEDLTGKTCKVNLKADTYNDRETRRITDYVI